MIAAGFFIAEVIEGLFLLARSFGRFERVDLLRFLDFNFNVRCGRAVAGHPLAFGIRIYFAVFS